MESLEAKDKIKKLMFDARVCGDSSEGIVMGWESNLC